jgi:hypothetical protein
MGFYIESYRSLSFHIYGILLRVSSSTALLVPKLGLGRESRVSVGSSRIISSSVYVLDAYIYSIE